MRRFISMAVLAAALFGPACARRQDTDTSAVDSTAAQTTAARQRLARIKVELDSLSVRAVRADARLRVKLGAQIDSLEARRAWSAARLDSLRSAGDAAWSRARAGTDTLLRALETSVARLRAKLEGRSDTSAH